MNNVRAHVYVTGRVQGVCFRMETQIAANERRLTGWVRNLADGRVEAIIEGEETQVKSMVQWCGKGPALARIDDVTVQWSEYMGEFKGFDIRYW